MFKRFLAVLLALVLTFSVSGLSVLADNDEDVSPGSDLGGSGDDIGMVDFDLDPEHYANAAAFANAVLAEAETYGETKEALALIQAANDTWENPRFTAAADDLIRSQWKISAEFQYNGDDETYGSFQIYEYDTAGNRTEETWYISTEGWDSQYSVYWNGEVISGYYVNDIVLQGYDENHRIGIRKGVNGWVIDECADPSDMYIRLMRGESDHRDRYEYNAAGRLTATYYRLSDDPEFVTEQNTYDESGTRLLETEHYWYDYFQGYTLYEYDEDGSLIKSTEYNSDGEEVCVICYEYDELGQRILEKGDTSYGQWTTEFQYQENGHLETSVHTEYDESGKDLLFQSEIIYDTYGNIQSENVDEVAESYHVYAYNEDGAVTEDELYYYGMDGDYYRDLYKCYEYTYFPLRGLNEAYTPDEIRGDGFAYILKEDGTAKITDCYVDETSETYDAQYLMIPEMLDGFLVTEIADEAFYSCYDIIELTIPDTVTSVGSNLVPYCNSLTAFHVSLDHPTLAEIDGVLFSKADKRLVAYPAGKPEAVYEIPKGIRIIGDKAFYECGNLTEVMIPETVTTIGDCAFWVCDGLTEITLPDSVKELTHTPFFACEQLREINVSPDHPVLSSIDGVLFTREDKTLICYPCGKEDTYYEVPEGICAIGYGAFCYCNLLTEIVVPDSVTEIGEAAFAEMRGPVTVDLGDGITEISKDAFKFSGVTKVILPKKLKVIGEDAFSDSAISDITFLYGLTTISDSAFWGCHQLTSVTLPDSVKEIAEYAFGWCSNLTEVRLPAGLTEISPAAFASCSSLTNIDLPDTVKVIGEGAFSGCGFTSIDIPDSVTEIGEYAFSSSKLERITIPDGITEIGNGAFQSCSSLTKVILPDSLRRIGDEAFAYCYALTDADLPVGLTEIGEEAFYMCQSLSGTEIPEGVMEIRERTFQGCESLTEVILPEGLTTIGHGAFLDCTSLKEMTIPGNVSYIDSAFSKYTGITLVVERDSYAHEYCLEQELDFRYTDTLDWLNN